MGTGETTAPRRPAAALAAIAILGLAYGVLFPDRTDYVGHFLAGAGGTFILVAIVVAVLPGRPWVVVGTVACAVLLGVLAEDARAVGLAACPVRNRSQISSSSAAVNLR